MYKRAVARPFVLQREVNMITNEIIVHKANQVGPILDGTMAPVRRLVNDNDLVVPVWQDLSEPEGVGTFIIRESRRWTK